MKRYGYGRQSISGEDIEAVRGVLQSDFLTQGPEVAAFEAELCRYTRVCGVIAASSFAGSRFPVSGSISTKRTAAPV